MTTSPFVEPVEKTAQEAIEAISDELALFDSWMERYQYIMDMGKKLPAFPEDWCIEKYRVEGCQSNVWLQDEERAGKLYFAGMSDALIVKGLVAMLLRVYSGRPPEEICKTDAHFLHDLGFVQALSTNRGNGVQAMAYAIQNKAKNLMN